MNNTRIILLSILIWLACKWNDQIYYEKSRSLYPDGGVPNMVRRGGEKSDVPSAKCNWMLI
jgi:hypothetical protein